MSDQYPSTNVYTPFDSDALGIFSRTQTNNLLTVSFLMLLLYDHIITLDREVAWIWTLRWRLPKIIFIINRYIITLLLLTTYIPNTIFPLSISFCDVIHDLWLYLPLLNFGAAELLLIIRVCSLYGHRKLVIWSLGLLFVVALMGALASQTIRSHNFFIVLAYEFLPGCWAFSYGKASVNQWTVWITFLPVEGIIMLLTVYKTLLYRNQTNKTIALLARDSLVYFIVVFACMASILASNVGSAFRVNIQAPTQCITSIAVGRMMMNIRGLILDDPEHTTHLKTLQFAARTNIDSEIEEDQPDITTQTSHCP